MQTGRVYRQFVCRDGRTVTLRAIDWRDVDGALEFVTSLIQERDMEPDIGIAVDRIPTREEELDWLARKLAEMEKGKQISVVAEVDGRFVGNSAIVIPHVSDMQHFGTLDISVKREYRNLGIGQEMMKTLLEEARKAGLEVVQLEVFADNQRAIHVYQKSGFEVTGRIARKVKRAGKYHDLIVMTTHLLPRPV